VPSADIATGLAKVAGAGEYWPVIEALGAGFRQRRIDKRKRRFADIDADAITLDQCNLYLGLCHLHSCVAGS